MTNLEKRVKNLEEMLDMISLQNKNKNIGYDKIKESINEFKKK